MLIRCLILMALAAPMFAGGGPLLLSIGNPAAVNDPAAAGALATVRVLFCGGRFSGAPTPAVTAEGLVNGRRVTQAVRVAPLQGSDLAAIHWSRPAAGTWVLRLVTSGREVYVPVGRSPIRPESHLLDWTAARSLDRVLAELAGAHAMAER